MSETRPLTDTPDGCWAPQWTVALPVIAKLVVKGTTSSSRLWLASRIAAALAVALPGRAVHLVGDAAYAGKELRQLAPGFTWTTRAAQGRRAARSSAGKDRAARPARDRGPAAHARQARGPPGDHPGHRRPLRQDRYRARRIPYLWYSVSGSWLVQVVLIRDRSAPRLRPGPGHHRHRRDRRAGHRTGAQAEGPSRPR